MQNRVSRSLVSNYRYLSYCLRASIISGPSSTAQFSSIPNRPTREGERRRNHGSEGRYPRDLDFGDDDNMLRGDPTLKPPNRPLRGERNPEPSRGSKFLNSARNPNGPMKGFERGDNDGGRFRSKIKGHGEVNGNDFRNSRKNRPTQFTVRPKRGEGSNGGSLEIDSRKEGGIDSLGDSVFQNLKFGEVGIGKKVTENSPNAPTQVTGVDPTVSGSSMKDVNEIFKKMKETGLIPNAVAMLDGLCKDGLAQEAMKLFGSIREKGSIPEVVVYTAVVEGFCKVEKFDDAKRVFRKMQKNGILPNAFSYTVLIQGLCKGKKLEDSVEFFIEMLDTGHSPNVATFTSLVEGFCTTKGVEEAEDVIKSLRERGFVVDEKAVKEHLEKKGPFSPIVREAIFGKESSEMAL